LSSSAFRIVFEGEPFRNGEIDVKDLAPALLAFGEVVQSANRALNGSRADARLKLKATRDGSFEALLTIDITMMNAVADMLDAVSGHPDRIVAADKLLDLLLKTGAVVAGTSVGLFKFIQWVAGRRLHKVERRENGKTLIEIDGQTIEADDRIVRLLADVETREALQTFGDRSLGVPGVSKLRIGENKAAEDVVLTPLDREAFKVPEPLDEEPTINLEEREVLLRIVTSHFRDGYKWRFTDGGEKPFLADMLDENFLRALIDGKTTLSANDTLRCRVLEEQKLSSAGLTKTLKVVDVLEHIPGARQLRLI